jgi:uncharacterized protein (TIGR02145 family)
MKRLVFLITSFCALTANAQNYLITFAGSGATTTVNSVKVENLTAGTSLTLNGSDILRLTGTVGINEFENAKSFDIVIYPNPMTEYSFLQIYPTEAGNVVISVLDMMGRLVTQISSYMDNNIQEYRLSGISHGSYLISVKGSNFHYSTKLISIGHGGGTISIEKMSNNQTSNDKLINTASKGDLATVDMNYTNGDRLKFTGSSGNYSTIKMDIPTSDKTITFNFIACTDGDNNNYPVVEIGTQTWMAENLKTTKYSTGDLIGTTSPATLNIISEITPRYQWAYAGNEDNVSVYGRLYTGYAITDNRNVCPAGWHVPSRTEWLIMSEYLGGESVTGNKLKETGQVHWSSPNMAATNKTGFTALPGGFRSFDGVFGYIGAYGSFNSTTEDTLHPGNTFYCSLSNNLTTIFWWGSMYNGISVRCIKNN